MKNILSVIGSPSTDTSNTRALVEDFIGSVKKIYNDFHHEVIMLGDKKIEYCQVDTTIGLGTINIGTLKATGCYKPGHFPSREKMQKRYEKLAMKTANILKNTIQPTPNFKNNWLFTGMKKKAYCRLL
jgi:hypothetical protein